MAYGDGSITQIRKNRFKVRVDFGKDPITGKRQVVSRNVRGTKAEARKVRDQIRKEHESGIKADASKITLSEFIDTWANAKLSSGVAAPETVEGDRSRLAHVERYIGAMPISRIDAKTIEQVYATIRGDRGLGGTSMNRIHSLLKSVLKKAVDYDLMLRNPCDRVVAPKKDDPDRKALTADECARLARCLDDAERKHRTQMEEKEQRMAKLSKTADRVTVRGVGKMGCIQAVRIALATGMRRGELAGLEWGSVDLEAGTIAVVQSRTKYNTNKAPKTKAGIRTIHIDDTTAKHLGIWKKEQAEALASIGIVQDAATPVCCNDKGGYMDLPNLERFWRNFKTEYGFEGLKLHELRHTQATQLMAQGVDVKTIQSRMGHANASITLDWYAHPVEENDEKAAGLVGLMLASGQQPAPETEVSPANVS